MHTFAVVRARPGRTVPRHVAEMLEAGRVPELTFAPDDHLHWASRDRDVQVAGWSAGAQHLGVGSHWHISPTGALTLFAGHPWPAGDPWAGGRTWAEQLADLVDVKTVDDVAPRLGGVFSLVVAEPDGRAAVTGDPLGVGLVHRGRNDDIDVFSNRAALAARLLAPAGAEPIRDVEGAVLLAYASNLQHGGTTFRDVRVQAQATVTHLAPGREAVDRSWSLRPWIDPTLDGIAGDELCALAVEDLRRIIRAQGSLPAPMRTLELTGGRDSRMILALLIAEGLAHDFVYITWGGPDIPDVQVAGALADRFGLDLRAQGRDRTPGRPSPAAANRTTARATTPPPAPPPLDYEARFRRHVWRTSGALSAFDLSTHGRSASPNYVLTGQFGELLRTNYPRTTGIGSVDHLEPFVRSGGFGFDAAGLLRPDVRRGLDDRLVAHLHDLLPPGGTAHDAIDGFNQTSRLRRWFGTSHELDNRNRLFPLYSMPATRAAFAIGSDRRRAEVIPFEVILATCPELATMDFAPSAWPETLVAGRPDADRYPTSPVPPPWHPLRQGRLRRRATRVVRPLVPRARERPKLAADQALMRDIDANLPVLRALADIGRDHAFYEHVDHDALMRAITDLPELPFLARRAVYDAVTAAAWMGGADVPETFT